MKKQDNGDEKSAEILKKGNDVGVTNNNWKTVTILLACALAISVGLHIWGGCQILKSTEYADRPGRSGDAG